jgi:hypothetical protein
MYIGQSRQLLYKFLLTRVAIGQPSWPLPRSASIQYHALARRALRRAYRHRLRRCMTQLRYFFLARVMHLHYGKIFKERINPHDPQMDWLPG